MSARRPTRKTLDAQAAPVIQVPADAPPWVSAELIEQTLRTWQPYYQTTLTPEVALYIIMSVGRLFDVLSRGDVA
jgi:hypothetical protein